MLLLFLAQGLWLTAHQTLSDRDYQYARCGREMWERPSPLAGYFTTCGNIHDGILAYRVAGLPLTLNLLAQRGMDTFRKPEDRVVQASIGRGTAELTTWELRHQMTHVLLLLRLPFLVCGCVLGGGLWWVTRRLYGNMGGYLALALYCFSPAILKACVSPNPEVLAALGVYGGIYTCIGVAHAMLGPRRKWRPRIVLLTVVFGIAAASHIAALPLAALMGLALMLWVAEGRRSQVLPVVLLASAGALLLVFACYGFSPDAFSYLFRSAAGLVSFSLAPARRFFNLGNAGYYPGRCLPRVALPRDRPLSILRQYRAVAVRNAPDGARHNRRAGKSMALGIAFRIDVRWRGLRRRVRYASQKNRARRCGVDRRKCRLSSVSGALREGCEKPLKPSTRQSR